MTGPALQLWGLTGGIASGKSTVARIFQEAGVPVLDADQITRNLSAPGGPAHQAILKRFGTADRKLLREKVFSDAQARKDLEAILHPLIQTESLKQAASLAKSSGRSFVLYEASLLVETGRYHDLAGLIVVEAPRELRMKRLIERDGMEPEMAQRVLDSQISDAERRKAATHVILNPGSLDELRKQVQSLIPQLSVH
jgi:dephospho-CoA kinase